MNTRNAANDALGPDEVTDPNIEAITSEKSGESVDDGAPAAAAPAAAAPATISEAIADAVSKGMVGANNPNLRVQRAAAGELTLADVIKFLKEKHPAFVLFLCMSAEEIPKADGSTGREWGVFFEDANIPYDPKTRKVIAKWLDSNSVRDFSRTRGA